jgi:hypothetical protein
MFDPVEFILLARQLAADPATVGATATLHGSARVRTSYGRAYYGLYLTVRREIASRHGLQHKQLNHGAVYTHLQNSKAPKAVRRLGRELQRLYTLRQTADYELTPREPWRTDLDNVKLAATLALRALALSRTVRQLDFAPVVPLFSRT